MAVRYPKVAQFKTVEAFRDRLKELELDVPIDDDVLSAEQESPLAKPLVLGPLQAGNRWCIHPMEGWDANRDGSPTDKTLRRWVNFGRSGAKLIWGGEAAAVRPDGRANPNQTMAIESNREGLVALRESCLAGHREVGLSTDDLVIGLQLTHSGRFCRPNSHQLEPRIAYHHPLLAEKYGLDPKDDRMLWTDSDLETLIDDYLKAAKLAFETGYQFVDVKACHGYLLHEFLSARTRKGKFGGDFEGRTRLLKTIISRIREEIPELQVVVRLSAFDTPPYQASTGEGDRVGEPMKYESLLPYQFGFGVLESDPLQFESSEPVQLIQLLNSLGVVAVNVTGGSPYYNPHLQRPAIFPPSDGYLPPEDPLVGVARHLRISAMIKAAVPEMAMVGTGYTYLQDYLPHVAQAMVRSGKIDSVGLGRMVLSYPELPLDTLAGREVARKKICRTFSDCTTAPRNGLPSGCYPLDDFYKSSPEFVQLKAIKKDAK